MGIAIATAVIAALILLIVREQPHDSCLCIPKSPGVITELKAVIVSAQSWLLAIYAGVMVAPVIAFAELWAVVFFHHSYLLPTKLAAQADTLIFIGIAIGGPINGWLSGLLGRRKPVMLIGNLMALTLFLLIIFNVHAPLYLLEIILFLFGFFTSSMLLCFPLNCERYQLSMSGTIIAFTNMIIMLFGAIFQPAIGYLFDFFTSISAHSFQLALLSLPTALFCNLIILYFIRENSNEST